MTKEKAQLSRNDWIALHCSLLEEERKAEVSAAQSEVEGASLKVLEARGVVLGHLVISERSTGLYGRPMITFVPARKDAVLPANNFSSGDIVGVCDSGSGQQCATGVVKYVSQKNIQIVLDDDADELDSLSDDTQLRLNKLANDVTYRRIKSGLTELDKLINGPAAHTVSVLFGESPPRSAAPSLPPQLTGADGKIQLFNKNLDNSQREAVEFAIQRSDLAVVHGPPGTGKTTTIVEVIRQHVKLKSKVLACAPSNLAVDNLVERLAAAKVRVVRVGHPARATPLTQRYTLDCLMHHSDESQLLKDIHRDINDQLKQLKTAKDRGKRQHIRREIKTFRKELYEREMRLTKQILMTSDVILATLTSSSNDGPLKLLREDFFDVVVIDECSQAIEAACYMSLLRAPKLIIAGDHCQLPPTIVSKEAAEKGLELSLMERVINQCGEEVVRMLTVQYRMNTDIMQWASTAMYQDRLVAHSSVASHLLHQMQGVTTNEDTERSLVLVDTAGCDCQELDTAEEQSKGNEGEAIIVSHYVRALLEAGLPEEDVAVITPYNLQVELVRGLLREDHPRVEVRSVDGFQGREKEAVVMSLVRSNKQGIVGFLSENRRLNVAVTRARRHLAVVCDSETVGTDPFLKGFLDYMVKHALVRTAFEFQHEMETTEVATPECISMRPKDEKKDKKSDSKNKKPNNRKDGKEGPKRKKGDSKPKYKPPTEEENQERRQKLEAIIKDFVNSASNVYQFPPGLNSFERRLVHEICDAEGLFHQSQGEGSERYLVVQKEKTGEGAEARNRVKEEEEKEKKDEEKEENDKEKEVLPVQVDEGEEEDERIEDEDEEEGQGEDKEEEEEENEDDSEFVEEREEKESPTADGGAIPKLKNLNLTDSKPRIAFINGMYQEVSREHNNTKADKTGDKMGKENEKSAARCQSCGKDILQQNFSVHSAQCERKMRAKKEEMERRKANQKKKKDERRDNKPGKDKKGEEEEEDFDSLIARFTKEDNTCSQPKCKTPTTVIFQQCPFCRKTFCLTHHMAEVHGCGDEARRHARAMVIREGVIYPGSGIPSKKPKDAKRKQLQRNLDKKLGDLTSQRQSKKPGKDKDKGKGTK